MDTKKFFKDLNRMCETLSDEDKCSNEGCPIYKKYYIPSYNSQSCYHAVCRHSEEIIDIVEQWAKDNPIKTRQSELLKIFPRVHIDNNIIDLCPAALDSDFTCKLNTFRISCGECRKKYWLEEIKDNIDMLAQKNFTNTMKY